jgi:8-oxo-dGTP diphosphatase
MTHKRAASRPLQYCYAYPHPAVATDIVVLTLRERVPHVLLIKRRDDPFGGQWALPGGFLAETETLNECAARELREETGLLAPVLEQYAIFSAPGRDPRERVISVAYGALVPSGSVLLRAGTDATEADWFPLANLAPLAFDHADIIDVVRSRVAVRVEQDLTLLFAFLADPEHFTLRELHAIYEGVTGNLQDRANFRRRIWHENLPVAPVGNVDDGAVQEQNVRHRPARYYRVVRS